MPEIEEESGLAAGRGHEPDAAAGAGGEGEREGKYHVFDQGGFVADEDVGGAAGAGFGGVADGVDSRAVVELEGEVVAADAAVFVSQHDGEADEFGEEFAGLFFGTGEDDDVVVGVANGVMERFDSDDGAFAPLAVAAEEDAFGIGVEDGFLDFVGFEIELFFGPFAGDWEFCFGLGFWFFWTDG